MNDSNKYYRPPHPSHRCGLQKDCGGCSLGPNGSVCSQIVDSKPRCYPVRTTQGWSKVLGVVFTLLATIAVFLVLPNWKSSAILAPGALSQVHAQLLHTAHEHSEAAILANDRCASCHPIALSVEEKELLVLNHTVAGKPAAVGLQSQLCLNCHHENMPNAREGTAHDLVGTDLQSLFASVLDSEPSKLAIQTTECSQCHREHRSSGESLAHITSQKCQACHRSQFHSFSHGHPEFENYPIPEPRRIAFDHTAHRDLHFAKKNKEFDCRACHVSENPSGQLRNVFRSVSFEKACTSCHTESLLTEATDGIVVLQLPSLDRAKLKSTGIDIGPWPESASQLMDGELSSLWRELIRNENGGEDVLANLPTNGKLSDIDWNSPSQLANMRLLADAMRNAFSKIALEGQPRIRTVMAQTIQNHGIAVHPSAPPSENAANVSEAWLAMFASGFPIDVVRLANERWFAADPVDDAPDLVPTQSIQAQSTPPIADNLIRQPKPKFPPGRVLGEARNTPEPHDNDTELLESDTNLLASDADLLGGDADLLESDGGLLAGDSLLDSPTSLLEKKPEGGKAELNPLRGWEHMPFGGWMLDEARVALVYIPKTHADGWLSRWIEWEWINGTLVNSGKAKFGIASQCIECHSMNQQVVQESLTGSAKNNNSSFELTSLDRLQKLWKIQGAESERKGLHKFNHGPHLTIASLSDCRSCHVLPTPELGNGKKTSSSTVALATASQSPGPSPATGEVSMESPPKPVKEFRNMTKVLCASCHQRGLAGDDCTQCHNYHVHFFKSKEKDPNYDHQLQAAQDLWHWTRSKSKR